VVYLLYTLQAAEMSPNVGGRDADAEQPNADAISDRPTRRKGRGRGRGAVMATMRTQRKETQRTQTAVAVAGVRETRTARLHARTQW